MIDSDDFLICKALLELVFGLVFYSLGWWWVGGLCMVGEKKIMNEFNLHLKLM